MEGGIRQIITHTCVVCGREFHATSEHVYKAGGRKWCCSYTCMRTAQRAEEETRKKRQEQKKKVAETMEANRALEKAAHEKKLREQRLKICKRRLKDYEAQKDRTWDMLSCRGKAQLSERIKYWKNAIRKAEAEWQSYGQRRNNP